MCVSICEIVAQFRFQTYYFDFESDTEKLTNGAVNESDAKKETEGKASKRKKLATGGISRSEK